MWNKKDTATPSDAGRPDSNPTPSHRTDTSSNTPSAPRPAAKNPGSSSRSEALVGPSTSINGEIRGNEDLLVLGRIDGKIECKKNRVTIGSSGHVKADIYGSIIVVEGQVHGNLFGGEQIVVKSSGEVHGNLVGPRVSLEDGARFKGSIDMGGPAGSPANAPSGQPKKAEPANTAKPVDAGKR